MLTVSCASMLTFGELLISYIDSIGKKPSYERYHQVYRQHLMASELHGLLASNITRYHVLAIKQRLVDTPSQCSKTIGLIKQAYNWAIDRIDPATGTPLYDGQNPAWRVSKHDSIPRERLMDHSEIKALLASLELLSPKYRAFFVARLLTPCRIKELCEMRRDCVNLSTGKWFKSKTKNGRPHYVLIPRQALDYLRELPVEGEYFFMGVYGRPLQRESATRIWGKFRKDLGMNDVWLLDFRRTLASYLYTEIKADDLTAKAVLNHYDGRPVAVYTRLNYDRLAEIIQQYADWIWALKPLSEEVSQCALHF